jgi:hypothetical protein
MSLRSSIKKSGKLKKWKRKQTTQWHILYCKTRTIQ